MPRWCRRWIALACFAAWAFGPVVGIGLAAHELEHHGPRTLDHSHAAQAAEAFLHGHVHEEDVGDHAHEIAPPSSTLSRLGQHGRATLVTVATAGRPARPDHLARPSGPRPELTAFAPPDPFGLCVLRL